MIPAKKRAEKLCMDALLKNAEVFSIYGRDHIYQGYVEPNTLASTNQYILIKRIDSIVQDPTTTGIGADRLRRVRLQIDVCDTRYTDMVRRAELIGDVLNKAFPSCLDGDTYGTGGRGQKVFNVASLDVIIFESARE